MYFLDVFLNKIKYYLNTMSDSLTWEQKVEKFGEPKKGHKYMCKVQHYHTKKIVDVELIVTEEDDNLWRTTDDNSEIDEMNWNIIEWIEVI